MRVFVPDAKSSAQIGRKSSFGKRGCVGWAHLADLARHRPGVELKQ
jgi:hypothetical protein